MTSDEEFRLANHAFELMPLPMREDVLQRFAKLRYPNVRDRFFEAVHASIRLPAPPLAAQEHP